MSAHSELTLPLTNMCTCMYCDDCSAVSYESTDDNKCVECAADIEPYENCSGECFNEYTEALSRLVNDWLEHNESESGYYVVSGTNMGWQGRSGFSVFSYDDVANKPWEMMSVNSEWTQYWSVDIKSGGTLKCVQTHHDAIGETYVIHPMTLDDFNKYYDEYER